MLQSDSLVRSKLACASGLFLLESGKYLQAARKFTEVRVYYFVSALP